MKLKSLILIVAALAALSVVVFFVRKPAPAVTADARLNQPVLDAATAEKVAELRLTESGKSLTVKRDTNGVWRVPSYHDFPVDFSRVTRLVGDLTEAKLTRLVTTNPDRIARLEFKDTTITLLDSAAKELWTVTLGKNPESGAGRFLRYGNEPKAFLASLNTYLDLESKNWANAELLALKPDDIAKIELPFTEGGPITFTRSKKEDPWTTPATPAGQKPKTDTLASALNTLTSIRFSDTSDSADAKVAEAKPHARAYTLTAFDGKTVTISLARKPEEKKMKPPVADKSLLGAATPPSPTAGTPAPDPKLLTPEFETIPAGPVFVSIAHSDAAAPVNALMAKRAFQIADYTFTSLPQKSADLFEPAPPPAPAAEPQKP
jgi:hypothetical protein